VAITFVSWLWGDKYPLETVEKLVSGLRRNMRQKFRFLLVTDQDVKATERYDVAAIEDSGLIGKGCFCRLRMFDPDWQLKNKIDDRMVGIDLDMVITNTCDSIFDRTESFVILRGVNAVNPNPFNCSIFMLRQGSHPEVWSEFSLDKADKITYHEFPDDQGWVWHMMPEAATWQGGSKSGIYAFQKPGWPYHLYHSLPINCRMVAFVGARKPDKYADVAWMKQHWKI